MSSIRQKCYGIGSLDLMRTERSAYFRKDEVVNQFTEEHYSIASLELAND